MRTLFLSCVVVPLTTSASAAPMLQGKNLATDIGEDGSIGSIPAEVEFQHTNNRLLYLSAEDRGIGGSGGNLSLLILNDMGFSLKFMFNDSNSMHDTMYFRILKVISL
jgi:hypothetical protein